MSDWGVCLHKGATELYIRCISALVTFRGQSDCTVYHESYYLMQEVEFVGFRRLGYHTTRKKEKVPLCFQRILRNKRTHKNTWCLLFLKKKAKVQI